MARSNKTAQERKRDRDSLKEKKDKKSPKTPKLSTAENAARTEEEGKEG